MFPAVWVKEKWEIYEKLQFSLCLCWLDKNRFWFRCDSVSENDRIFWLDSGFLINVLWMISSCIKEWVERVVKYNNCRSASMASSSSRASSKSDVSLVLCSTSPSLFIFVAFESIIYDTDLIRTATTKQKRLKILFFRQCGAIKCRINVPVTFSSN